MFTIPLLVFMAYKTKSKSYENLAAVLYRLALTQPMHFAFRDCITCKARDGISKSAFWKNYIKN
jgi:hypothetical protein